MKREQHQLANWLCSNDTEPHDSMDGDWEEVQSYENDQIGDMDSFKHTESQTEECFEVVEDIKKKLLLTEQLLTDSEKKIKCLKTENNRLYRCITSLKLKVHKISSVTSRKKIVRSELLKCHLRTKVNFMFD